MFWPSSRLDLLFDPKLIPQSIRDDLGDDLEIRPLSSTDNDRGLFEVLSVLTVAPNLSQKVYETTFRRLKSSSNTYFTVVVVQKAANKIVGAGTIVMEQKLVRNAGLIGHIEDIAVSKTMQGRKLGLRIINTLEQIGRAMGCYKIILDCSKENIPFYEKCGFKHKEFQMVLYVSDPPLAGKPQISAHL